MPDNKNNISLPLCPIPPRDDTMLLLHDIFVQQYNCREWLKKYTDFQADLVTDLTELYEFCSTALTEFDNLPSDDKKRLEEIKTWTFEWIEKLSERHFEDDEASHIILESITDLEIAHEFL